MKALRRYFDIVSEDDKTLFNRIQGPDGHGEDCDCDVCMLKKREFERAMKEDWNKKEKFGPFIPKWWTQHAKN